MSKQPHPQNWQTRVQHFFLYAGPIIWLFYILSLYLDACSRATIGREFQPSFLLFLFVGLIPLVLVFLNYDKDRLIQMWRENNMACHLFQLAQVPPIAGFRIDKPLMDIAEGFFIEKKRVLTQVYSKKQIKDLQIKFSPKFEILQSYFAKLVIKESHLAMVSEHFPDVEFINRSICEVEKMITSENSDASRQIMSKRLKQLVSTKEALSEIESLKMRLKLQRDLVFETFTNFEIKCRELEFVNLGAFEDSEKAIDDQLMDLSEDFSILERSISKVLSNIGEV